MADRITKAQLAGMLIRATHSGREVGALTESQELTTYVPWSHAVIVVSNVDRTGGVRPVTERGGATVRALYEQAHTLAVAFELVAQGNREASQAHVSAMARATGIK
jgi:hypothetical protein